VIVGKKWEHSSKNEIRSLNIFMNEVEMNNEPFEERSKNLQTKTNRISQTKTEKIEKNLGTIS
jgi:hypothetical protein